MLEQLNQDERVVQGLPNREIAQEPPVSVRTVGLRLIHIFRSLGSTREPSSLAVLTGAPARPTTAHGLVSVAVDQRDSFAPDGG
jgi:hypothetical protein